MKKRIMGTNDLFLLLEFILIKEGEFTIKIGSSQYLINQSKIKSFDFKKIDKYYYINIKNKDVLRNFFEIYINVFYLILNNNVIMTVTRDMSYDEDSDCFVEYEDSFDPGGK